MKQAKPARRGKQEYCGRHNETGEACPKGKARRRMSAFIRCNERLRKTSYAPHQSTSLTAFPPGGSLDEGKIKTYPLSSAYADTFPKGESKETARLVRQGEASGKDYSSSGASAGADISVKKVSASSSASSVLPSSVELFDSFARERDTACANFDAARQKNGNASTNAVIASSPLHTDESG